MNSRYKSVGESSLVGCRELNKRVIESPVLQSTLRGRNPILSDTNTLFLDTFIRYLL
jgi:hypothetical protein